MHIVASKSRRAYRYAIRTDVRFRPEAVQNWHIGETENISDTGLLVRALEELPIDTPIQLELYAPVPLSGVAQSPMMCNGRVVRSFRASGDKGLVRLAIEVQSPNITPAVWSHQKPKADPDTYHTLANQLAIVVGTAELVLANSELDADTVARIRKIKDVSMEAATTAKKMVT